MVFQQQRNVEEENRKEGKDNPAKQDWITMCGKEDHFKRNCRSFAKLQAQTNKNETQ